MCKKYKNLIIIGNGFDRWQGLPSSYEEFRKYYYSNIDRVISRLGIGLYETTDESGAKISVNPVELIYGYSLNSKNLTAEFFRNFEAALDKIDDQKINLFFGRSDEGIKNLQKAVADAQLILRTLFSEWICQLNFKDSNSEYKFSDDCYFINFNYTDTLERIFGVNSENVFHIHGSANDAKSIIFGHSSHPETAFKELIEHHFITSLKNDELPRLKGLYAIEDALYQTDKHVMDRIDAMCLAMHKRGVHIEDFENIYVLGQSFGDQDIEYFNFIDKVTRCGFNYDALSAVGLMDETLLGILSLNNELSEYVLLDLIQLNIEYAAHHRERVVRKAKNLFPQFKKWDKKYCRKYEPIAASEAVWQRFLLEQAGRTRKILEKMAADNGVQVPEDCHSILSLSDYLDGGHDRREADPVWHISYFSKADKKHIKKVMKRLWLKNYKLYPSIDECISNFKI